MAELRELLAQAQAAEQKGDKVRAVELLRRVAELYRDSNNASRALKMLRQIRRLEGRPDVEGDDAGALFTTAQVGLTPVERGPALADPDQTAWCSFCCRPDAEVGRLVGGPTGTFMCASCLRASAKLLGEPVHIAQATVSTKAVDAGFLVHEAIEAPLERLARGEFRLALVVGPTGAGKSAIAAEAKRRNDRLVVFDGEPVELRGARPHIVVARGTLPEPSLVLRDVRGAESPVWTTEALAAAVGTGVDESWVAGIDEVVGLPSAAVDTLERLALHWCQANSVKVEPTSVRALAELAAKSPRGAHELYALLKRIPKAGRRA